MDRFLHLAAACLALAPAGALAQPAAVDAAYVEIVPAGSSDVDDILAVERGVELVLCQAGVRRRVDGSPSPAELKLVASLAAADARCEITGATATLPGGASVPLPDMAIAREARGSAGTFFLGCGASFTRAALDALKERIVLRGAGCTTLPRR